MAGRLELIDSIFTEHRGSETLYIEPFAEVHINNTVFRRNGNTSVSGAVVVRLSRQDWHSSMTLPIRLINCSFLENDSDAFIASFWSSSSLSLTVHPLIVINNTFALNRGTGSVFTLPSTESARAHRRIDMLGNRFINNSALNTIVTIDVTCCAQNSANAWQTAVISNNTFENNRVSSSGFIFSLSNNPSPRLTTNFTHNTFLSNVAAADLLLSGPNRAGTARPLVRFNSFINSSHFALRATIPAASSPIDATQCF